MTADGQESAKEKDSGNGLQLGHLLPDARILTSFFGSVWKVRTQDSEKFVEEVKSLVTAWLRVPERSQESCY